MPFRRDGLNKRISSASSWNCTPSILRSHISHQETVLPSRRIPRLGIAHSLMTGLRECRLRQIKDASLLKGKGCSMARAILSPSPSIFTALTGTPGATQLLDQSMAAGFLFDQQPSQV